MEQEKYLENKRSPTYKTLQMYLNDALKQTVRQPAKIEKPLLNRGIHAYSWILCSKNHKDCFFDGIL